MRVQMHTILTGITLVVLFSLTATAGAPQLVSYQGRLTNGSGQTVPNGVYDLNFRIYDDPTAGSVLWHETHNGVQVTDGLFNVMLGSTKTPSPTLDASIFADTSRWLGVTIGAGTELTPRVRLGTAQYAFRVATVDGASGGNISGNVAASGTVSSGSPTQTGLLNVYMNGAAQPVVSATNWGAFGGALLVKDETNDAFAALEADIDGTGGYLAIDKGDKSPGFQVDGNYSGSGDPLVSIIGSSRSVTMNMGQTGSSSVTLPSDAVEASEMLDEPGVATAVNGSTLVKLTTGGFYTLLSRTITLPADGYVLAIGTCQPIFNHWNLTQSYANFGVSTSTSSLPVNQDIGIVLPASSPTGDYNWPVTAQTVFNLTAGVHTLYFLASKGSVSTDTIDVWDMQLTLVYLPTAYGTVTVPVAANLGDDVASSVSIATPDPATERQESVEANNARITKELAVMKADLQLLRQKLEQLNGTNVLK